MNLDIEQGILNYALAQLAAQDPAPTAIPIDRDHLFAGSTANLVPERDCHLVFSVSEDITHEVEDLYIATLTQLVRTPRLTGGENDDDARDSAVNLGKHRAMVRATGELDEEGANPRLWFPSAGNIALLSEKVAEESGYQVPGWFIESSSGQDQSGMWVHVKRIRIKLMLA